jgi:hypothetical protein
MRIRVKYQVAAFLLISFQAFAQPKLPAGYPDRSSSFDVLPGFIHPPKGYGEVPFYWWQGDTITRERLLWQLNQLENKGISSLQVNYSHRDYGGISYGLSNPSKPALFTEEWWKLFKWFAAEAKKRNMTVSLSDYTIGVGQGFSMDEALRDHPELTGSQLKNYSKILSGKVDLELPENLLALTAIKLNADSSLNRTTRKNMLPEVKSNNLSCTLGNETWKLTGVYAEKLIPSYDPMHPLSGKAYNQYFFDKFAKALPDNGSGMLNFFFSDELNFRVNGNIWDDNFASEFKKRKGYDVVPFLDALYENIGDITPKIRLDYNDVLVALSEENFFKPVYLWHQDRGLIFGCDHGGRGKDVAEFGDYFRTQRWNQGPGSDQPMLSKDIVKAKVASSIAHLYNRPRVWLEGFHSSGWGTSSADVTDAIFADYVAGYNLLSFHGLYYSTMGGWWEWAPPCNHFRMPYWKQIDPLMNCVERLSFLLSQGVHRCDVAIMYPTEPVVAGMDGKKSVDIAFKTGEQLYNSGIDFDFIDFESLARCEVKDAALNVSGEKYKVLVIPSMKVMRDASLRKIEEFKKAGGIIVVIGEKPQATDKNGQADSKTSKWISGIFSDNKNLVQCGDPRSVSSAISEKYSPDFKMLTPQKERPYVMHRVIGKRDVYALYNFQAGSKCFFKAKGAVQLWNPWNGEVASISGFAHQTNDGTEVDLPLSFKEIQIIVFDSDNTECKNVISPEKLVKQIALDNVWEFELKPSLDNQWGDFQLPAKNEFLGAQVRQMHFKENSDYSGEKLTFDESWKNVTCAFGPQFLKLGALPELPSESELLKMIQQKAGNEVELAGTKYRWEEYCFSWQQGVEGDYGHQGYHGLKGKMYDDFIRLGAVEEVKMSKFRVSEPAGKFYVLSTNVVAPVDGVFDLLTGEVKPVLLFVNNQKTDPKNKAVSLKKGVNSVLMVYDKACETYLAFRQPEVLRPAKQPVSMCWYGDSGVLPFDCSAPGEKSGLFAFESAPGLNSLTFEAYGNIGIWTDGVLQQAIAEQRQADGLTSYRVDIKNPKLTSSQVVLKVDYQPGRSGAGAFPKYLEQECGKGVLPLGDWSKVDGLKAYSGGAWYRKTIQLDARDLKNKLEIDLGDLVSSAELLVNGKSAGIRLSPPWKFDITPMAKEGENLIEVLVYNTLANNFTSIPTRYPGKITSGLLGPVKLNVIQQTNLK